MPRPNKSELVKELAELGEAAPKSWTMVEIETRILEICEEQGRVRYTGGKLKTPFKMAMVELNKNSKKKSDLQTYLQTSLQMHITGHETIAQLQKMAIKKIYQCTSPEDADPVGFGEHCSLSYQEVLATQPRYCEWVLKTASEGQCDYRLDRLAQWVKLQWEVRPPSSSAPPMPTKGYYKETRQDQPFKGKGKGVKELEETQKIYPSPGSDRMSDASVSSSQMALLQQMAETLATLKEDVESPEDRATTQEDRAQGGREDLFDGLICGGRPLKQGDPSERAVKKQATFEGLVLSPVDVSGKWEPLPMPKARQLAWQAESLVTSTFESLVSHDRVQILEVACSPNSILSETMRELTGSDRTYKRCSLFNEYDLGTNQGIRKVIHEVDVENPKHVWLSPICGPFSVMQNINQRTPEQKEALQAKRQEAMKHYVGCAIIYTYCVQKGIDVTWEWSQSCQAWRLPLIQKLIEKHQPHFSIVRGCQVGLKTEQGEVISKGWKLMTTSKLLAKRMDLPCRCPKQRNHVKCEGSLTGKTAYYIPTFARRVCQAILQGNDPDELKKELQGLVEPQKLTGMGTVCGCPPKGEFGYPLQCGHCTHLAQSAIQDDSECLVAQGSRNSLGDGLTKEEIRRRLYLLHSATGHGPLKHLVQSLKRRGVSSEIIEEAEKFECSVCKEKGRPKPRPFASLEPHPPKWSTVSGDVGHWEHPQTKEHVQFLMVVDEGSRFRVGRVVASGKRSHVNAAQFVSTFQECWLQYFGNPHV